MLSVLDTDTICVMRTDLLTLQLFNIVLIRTVRFICDKTNSALDWVENSRLVSKISAQIDRGLNFGKY